MTKIDLDAALGSPQTRRWSHASKVKEFDNIEVPYPLAVWNYDPCHRHEEPRADCMWHECGGKPYKHQNKTATFSYLARKSLVGNSTGTGKQQPVDEPVLTPTGWRKIGGLKPGDLVIGANGLPTKVLEVHPQTERRTFLVIFNDGAWTRTGPDHLWLARRRHDKTASWEVVTTQYMLDNKDVEWSIPMIEPPVFSPKRETDFINSKPPHERFEYLKDYISEHGKVGQSYGGAEVVVSSTMESKTLIELCQSLGGNSYVKELKEGYRLQLNLPKKYNPFKDKRRARMYSIKTPEPERYVFDIYQIEDRKSVCITVEAEDSLYVTRNYIVTHNTINALQTIAIANHYEEPIKTLVVVPTISVKQWHAETERWCPGFNTVSIPSKTSKKDRLHTYASKWDILIMGYHSFARDVEHIDKIGIKQVIVDDVDPALNVNNSTFRALERICLKADIVIDMNATSLQTHLTQLYAASCLIGGRQVWGSKSNFEKNFVKKEKVPIRVKGGEFKHVYQAVGYKNLELLRRKFEPMSIRITYEDIADDVEIPSLVTEQIYLDMSNKQRARYDELKSGVRTIMSDDNMTSKQKSVNALTAFTIGSQICAGTFALKTTSQNYEPDGPEASPKLDWIMEKLTDDWKDEKVVIYAKFRGSIQALQGRLNEEGIGSSTIWGVETDSDIRKAEMDRFWEDPDTRVMIISVSGERSLNLQNASILVMWDLQLNPARVAQIAGRVRRVGSTHKRVFVFELLMNDTQEERYMGALASRQALFDFVYDVDDSAEDPDTMLIQKLDPEEILKLIQP